MYFQRVLSLVTVHVKHRYSLVALGQAYLASASTDCTIRLWDCDTSTCLGVLKGHEEAVTCLGAFLGPSGSLVRRRGPVRSYCLFGHES